MDRAPVARTSATDDGKANEGGGPPHTGNIGSVRPRLKPRHSLGVGYPSLHPGRPGSERELEVLGVLRLPLAIGAEAPAREAV
jgi:hypothetical protein